MKTTNSLVLAAALVLGTTAAGCGGDYSMMDPPGGSDPGPGPGGTTPSRPLDASGTFDVHSTFDLATNAPGTVGKVVNTFIDATDSPDDPTHWILDQIIGTLSTSGIEGQIRSALSDAEPFAAPLINNELKSVAPKSVDTILTLSQDFGLIAKQFGLTETMALTRNADGSYTAVHTVTGLHFQIGNQESDLSLANYSVPDIVVQNVDITMDQTGQMTIAPHDVPLALGQVLRVGLDAGVIPLIDPSARNLGDLLAHNVDCQAIGTAIANQISLISASTAAGFCSSGLQAGAALIYSKISSIDSSALKFTINGTAHGADTDGDRVIDAIQVGTWSGTLTYGSSPAPLSPSAFYGTRM